MLDDSSGYMHQTMQFTLQFKSAMSIPVDRPQQTVAKCHNAPANSNVQWQACIIQWQQQNARVRRLRPAHFDRIWYARYIHSATRYCKHENLLEGRGGAQTQWTHTFYCHTLDTHINANKSCSIISSSEKLGEDEVLYEAQVQSRGRMT